MVVARDREEIHRNIKARDEEIHGYIGGDDDHHEWSFEENKVFENAVAELMSKDIVGSSEEELTMVHQIATRVPGKTVTQIKHHLKALSEDIEMIEKGLVPIPNYEDRASNVAHDHNGGVALESTKSTSNTVPRRRGIPWTKEEHELFLEGLERYGKGDWRSISRLCVVTRTPTQVASHAQKHFLRCENANKKKKKKKIKQQRPNKCDSASRSRGGHDHDHHYHHVPDHDVDHISVSQGLIGAVGNANFIKSTPLPPCPSCQRPYSS